jgi:hypothetical protein
MFHILYQYLIQNKSVSLPGVGTLLLQNIPAISNFSNHVIEPPSHKIVFDDTQDAPSKSLFQYIALKLGLQEWEAIKKVNDFSYELKNQLKKGDEIIWQNVGVLHLEPGGGIALESKTIAYNFMESVPAIRVIRTNSSHTILRGDTEVSGNFTQTVAAEKEVTGTSFLKKWWVWAVFLGAAASTVLVIHFYNNGFKIDNLFNTQQSPVKEAPATYK